MARAGFLLLAAAVAGAAPLSCGRNDRGNLARSIDFARLLTALGVRHRTFFAVGGHNGRFWETQLPAALRYAFPVVSHGESSPSA